MKPKDEEKAVDVATVTFYECLFKSNYFWLSINQAYRLRENGKSKSSQKCVERFISRAWNVLLLFYVENIYLLRKR